MENITPQITEMQNAIQQQDWDKAQSLLQAYISESLSPEDTGRALLTFGTMYLEAKNSIDRAHRDFLQQAISDLQALEQAHASELSEIDLALARKKLE